MNLIFFYYSSPMLVVWFAMEAPPPPRRLRCRVKRAASSTRIYMCGHIPTFSHINLHFLICDDGSGAAAAAHKRNETESCAQESIYKTFPWKFIEFWCGITAMQFYSYDIAYTARAGTIKCKKKFLMQEIFPTFLNIHVTRGGCQFVCVCAVYNFSNAKQTIYT